jgi:multiple sugar transport system permease protein
MVNKDLKKKSKGAVIAIKTIRVILIVIVLVVFLFPVFWIVTGSLKNQVEFYSIPPKIIPNSPTLNNFITALSERGLKGILDSFIVSIVSTILSMIIAIPASYAIARYKPGGTQISFFILSILFLPPVIGVIPLFFIFKTLKLLDSYYVLFISYLFFNLPFSIWLMKGFFEDIPVDLEQAVMVDGYSRFRVFSKIAIPLAKPGIAVAGLFAFIFSWNELMFASIFSRNAVSTLPLVLQDYIGSTGIVWGQLSALATIAAIPGILLAVFMQRYIVRGLSFGAVKG